MSRPFNRLCRGFTLVELMVVIGVVALLLGLLLPALGQARSAARTSTCLSNQRQIAVAAFARANDAQGYLPLGGNAVIDREPATPGSLREQLQDSAGRRYIYAKAWSLSLWPEEVVPFPLAVLPMLDADTASLIADSPYNVSRIEAASEPLRLFRCPDEAANEFTYSSYSGWTCRRPTLPVTYENLVRNPWDFALNLGVVGFDRSTTQGRARGLLSRVRGPSDVVLLAGYDRLADLPLEGGSACFKPVAGEVDRAVTMRDALENDPRESGSVKLSKSRHRGRVEILFVDGHATVVPVKPDALGSVLLRLP